MQAVLRVLAAGVVAALVACGGRSTSQKDSADDDAGEGGTGGARGGRTGSGGTTGPLGGTNGNSGGAPGGTTAFGGTAGARGGAAGAPGGTTGAIGGTTAFGGTSGTGMGGQANDFVVEPDETGCVWGDDPNDLPVEGCFYVFGDQYPDPNDAKCLIPGMHTPAECSIIESPPPPPAIGFPQAVPGVMCTTGTVAQVLPCAPTVTSAGCPVADYANMWGAGMGFDLNADQNEFGGTKRPWDPSFGGFIGFSFDIDTVPLPGLRVEIPMLLTYEEAARATPPLASGSTTDKHPDGSPYWGATSMYPNSPVISGTNRVLWSDIRPPRPENYTFDTTRMISIHFHVPANTSSRQPYAFCIKNLTLLRE